MSDVAIVTGAGGDIGTACALALAESVDVVACVDRSPDQLAQVVDRLAAAGHHGVAVVADAEAHGFGALVADAAAGAGVVRSVVHGIAFEEHRAAQDMDLESVLRSFSVGPLAALSLFREVKSAGRPDDRPSFLAISSLHADHAFVDCIGYNAAHAALKAVIRTLASEWAAEGIRVNGVAPGWIRTEGEERMYGSAYLDAAGAGLPFGVMGTADQVARAVAFLASPAADYVSGTVLTVDGALSASLARLPGGDA